MKAARLACLLLLSGCGGMNLEFGGIRFQTGGIPDTRSRSVFGPAEENYQIINPVPAEIRYESQRTTTVRRRSAPKPVLPPAATPCPTIAPVTE